MCLAGFQSKANANQYFEENLIARGVNYFIKTVKYELQLVYVVKRAKPGRYFCFNSCCFIDVEVVQLSNSSINNHLTTATRNAASTVGLV